MGGQAVHKKRIRFCLLHELAVDLVVSERFFTGLLFLLLAHARPDVRYHKVAVFGSFHRVSNNNGIISATCQYIFVRIVALGACDVQFKAKLDRCIDIGMAHIVSIAYPSDRFPFDTATVFDKSEHIGQ